MSIIRVVDEFRGHGVAVVLEKGGFSEYGQYVLKVHRHFCDENAARTAFTEATKPRRTRKER